MHRIGDKVYFIRDCIIEDGFIVGVATFTLKNKIPSYLYLVGKEPAIETKREASDCFDGDLPEYLLLSNPDALFESVEALQKRQKELYFWSKGCRNYPFDSIS
jgi:hypothetical protein